MRIKPESIVEKNYLKYISTLNAHHTADLSEFVHETLVYNGRRLTRIDYQQMIADGITAVPDLYYDVDILVVNEHHIACRINFQCTPKTEFLGMKTNGKKVSFSEHVFYKIADGKIEEIWSLIDKDAIRSEMKKSR